GAFGEQTVEQRAVGPVGLEYRVGDALHRVLVVVEAGGAEGEVKIDHHRIQREIARDRPGDVVRHGRGADAALGADYGNHPAGGHGLGRREQAADRAHDVEHADRADHVIVDAAANQLAIGHVIGFVADDDYAGAGVAHARELVEHGH